MRQRPMPAVKTPSLAHSVIPNPVERFTKPPSSCPLPEGEGTLKLLGDSSRVLSPLGERDRARGSFAEAINQIRISHGLSRLTMPVSPSKASTSA